MIDYHLMTATEHRKRWAAAVAREWDFTDVAGELPPERDRPGLHPEHIFDFHDGLRLVVSVDRYNFGTHLHVSASLRPKSSLWQKAWHGKLSPNSLGNIVVERVQFIGGRQVTLAYITEEKGIPHYYDPPLPAEAAFTPNPVLEGIPVVAWDEIVTRDWRGACVVCGRQLTSMDFEQQQVVAAGEKGNPAVCCRGHIEAGGEEYRRAVRALAEAVATNVREKGGDK